LPVSSYYLLNGGGDAARRLKSPEPNS